MHNFCKQHNEIDVVLNTEPEFQDEEEAPLAFNHNPHGGQNGQARRLELLQQMFA